MFKESHGGHWGWRGVRGNDIRDVIEGHVCFCKTLSFSLSEERSDDMMSCQDLGAMLRMNC